MPPRGHGGPPPGDGGFFGHNYTMRDANSAIDRRRTFGRPDAVPGVSGTGYIPDEDFSVIDIFHRIKLARILSLHPNGASRFRSFVGNYQALTHDASKRARLEKMTVQLMRRHKDGEIDDQEYGERLMYEADKYYSWLRSKTVLSEQQYREAMMHFAGEHGIDYDFGDSGPTRTV